MFLIPRPRTRCVFFVCKNVRYILEKIWKLPHSTWRGTRRGALYDLGSVLCLQVLDHPLGGNRQVSGVHGTQHTGSGSVAAGGTLTLFIHDTADVYRGFDALQTLQNMAVDHARQRGGGVRRCCPPCRIFL